jgi:hypothetical protein
MLNAKHFLYQFMGVRRLFPGGGENLLFPKNNKKDTIFTKILKNLRFLAGRWGWGKRPVAPPPSGRPCTSLIQSNNIVTPSDDRSSSPSTSPKPTAPKSLSSSSSSSLPRKLVRGQDVWLGKGQEQTRQILKCMWCGQSFPSLADLTVHMQVFTIV